MLSGAGCIPHFHWMFVHPKLAHTRFPLFRNRVNRMVYSEAQPISNQGGKGGSTVCCQGQGRCGKVHSMQDCNPSSCARCIVSVVWSSDSWIIHVYNDKCRYSRDRTAVVSICWKRCWICCIFCGNAVVCCVWVQHLALPNRYHSVLRYMFSRSELSRVQL